MLWLFSVMALASSLPTVVEKQNFSGIIDCQKSFSTEENYSNCVKSFLSQRNANGLEQEILILFRGLEGVPALRGCSSEESQLLKSFQKVYCFTANFAERKALGAISFDAKAKVKMIRLF